MSDLISRRAAIETITNLLDDDDISVTELRFYDFGLKRACEILGELPSAQQEQRWIPVSERLPEQDQICLICGKNGGIYVARFWRNETLILWTKTGTGKFAKAVAWMPLPEPYKEEVE